MIHFSRLKDGRNVCLVTSNKNTYLLIGNSTCGDEYELITEPMEYEDAYDICTQKDVLLAKMMLQKQMSKREQKGTVGTKEEIAKLLDRDKILINAFSILLSSQIA